MKKVRLSGVFFSIAVLGLFFLFSAARSFSEVILQDDFESGYTIINNHSNLSALSNQFKARGWDGIWWDGNSYLEVSSARARSGAYSVKHAFNADQDRATLYLSGFGSRDALYVSYWVYFNTDYYMNWSLSGGEQKFARYFTGDGHTGSVLVSQHLYPNQRFGTGVRMQWQLTTAGGMVFAQNYDFSQNKGKWIHLEYYFKLNTPGVRDGVIRMWIDGVKQQLFENYTSRNPSSTPIAVDDSSFIIRTSLDQHFRSFWLLSLHNGTPTPPPATVYLDDVLVADSVPGVGPSSPQNLRVTP